MKRYAAAAGTLIALLLADVVVPVPSSLVMLAQDALFGVVGGAVLSLAGAVGAAMTGLVLGAAVREVSPALVAADRGV